MSGVQPARMVAFEVILQVDTAEAYANLLLPTLIRKAGLTRDDAALATELAYGALRQQGRYDEIIRICADRDPATLDAPVRAALRLGIHQLLATRVASHAAVNESVGIVRQTRGAGAAGFANAVLRKVARTSSEEWTARLVSLTRSDDEMLGIESAHPVWVLRAFRRALRAEGREDELPELLAADNRAPAVTMIALPGLGEVPESARRTDASPYGFRLHGGGDPDPLIRRSHGALRVQDEGSQLVALALAGIGSAEGDERWLDLCAGPGGKTALLAAIARQRGATVEANEIVPARAGLVRRALHAVPGHVTVHERDGLDLAHAHPDAFDRILVDAPCTGLGALRRRPEARWRKRPEDVAPLTALQGELLDAALGALKPGGVVAYVTCSPHLAETAAVVADVRERWGSRVEELDARAALQAVARTELDLPVPLDGSGHAQLWPHRHGTDAMFLALLRRTA